MDTAEGMAAGYETDTLIATAVMGLPATAWDEHTRCAECGGEMRYCGTRSRCTNCNEWRHSPYREYSDDIVAAMSVVEHMARFDLELVYGATAKVWTARFGMYRSAEADTAPLAICRAAFATISE